MRNAECRIKDKRHVSRRDAKEYQERHEGKRSRMLPFVPRTEFPLPRFFLVSLGDLASWRETCLLSLFGTPPRFVE